MLIRVLSQMIGFGSERVIPLGIMHCRMQFPFLSSIPSTS